MNKILTRRIVGTLSNNNLEDLDNYKNIVKKTVAFNIDYIKNCIEESISKEKVSSKSLILSKLLDNLRNNGHIISYFSKKSTRSDIDKINYILDPENELHNDLIEMFFKDEDERKITVGKPSCNVYVDNNSIGYCKNDTQQNMLKSILSVLISKMKKTEFIDTLKEKDGNKKQHNLMDPNFRGRFFVGLDFDGVITNHNVKFDPNNIDKIEINNEIEDLIKTSKDLFEDRIKFIIFSMRTYDENGLKLIKEFLEKYGLINYIDNYSIYFGYYDKIIDNENNQINTKYYPFDIYLDDRVINMPDINEKYCENTLNNIINFKPWHGYDLF